MIGITKSVSLHGFESFPVQVEVSLLPGTMSTQIVGLADNSAKECRDRVRAAIVNSGFSFPVKFMVINLAPNEKQKEGGFTELAIAIAILIASGQVDGSSFSQTLVLGSLSLDGSIQPPRGMLAATILAHKLPGINAVVLPEAAMAEVGFLPSINMYPIRKLSDINKLIAGQVKVHRTSSYKENPPPIPSPDLKAIRGLEPVKKGLSFAIAGGHHCLMIGEPGTGKTMLARACESIQPSLTLDESLEITRLYSLSGLSAGNLITNRPFRNPHHTTSDAALVGGGSIPSPGEVSLAHKGILFLDELLEFSNATLQSLREPMQDKKITVSRSKGSLTFPADFLLIAATNPCRCGYLFSNPAKCSCRKAQALNLLRKIVGPFSDRIALEIETRNEFLKPVLKESHSSAWYRSKIKEARNRMYFRNNRKVNGALAAEKVLDLFSELKNHEKLANDISNKLQLSYRGLIEAIRVARTIADFEEVEVLTEEHIHQALAYRVLKNQMKVLNLVA